MAAGRMEVRVLGTAQDGGVPHVGCGCDRCETARVDPSAIRFPSALLVTPPDAAPGGFLIDATPDVRFQLAAAEARSLRGVFVSHVHLGHVPGLLSFGAEGLGASGLPVYCTARVRSWLESNRPYAGLVERDRVEIRVADPGDPVPIPGGAIEPRAVPHRGETDTVGYAIDGPERTLWYASDLDRLTDDVVDQLSRADVALVDGTFYREDEVPGFDSVPHPPIETSMDRLADLDAEIAFTHLNHTNPALTPNSPERRRIEERGFAVAERGTTVDL